MPENNKNQQTSYYDLYDYKLKVRHESNGDSEFCITGAHITETGYANLICKKDNGTYDSWKEIKKVDKDDINVMLYHWEQLCDNEVTPFNTNFVFWNTYERDWAKSDKGLGSATKNGTTIYLYGKRRYSSDWFAFDPDCLSDNPLDLNHIYYNWAKWYDSDNSKVRAWRIQP